MTQEAECADALGTVIHRADRDELGAAQSIILRYALGFPGPADMSQGMTGLKVALENDPRLERLPPLQAAFQTAIVAMISRTEAEVSSRAISA